MFSLLAVLVRLWLASASGDGGDGHLVEAFAGEEGTTWRGGTKSRTRSGRRESTSMLEESAVGPPVSVRGGSTSMQSDSSWRALRIAAYPGKTCVKRLNRSSPKSGRCSQSCMIPHSRSKVVHACARSTTRWRSRSGRRNTLSPPEYVSFRMRLYVRALHCKRTLARDCVKTVSRGGYVPSERITFVLGALSCARRLKCSTVRPLHDHATPRALGYAKSSSPDGGIFFRHCS